MADVVLERPFVTRYRYAIEYQYRRSSLDPQRTRHFRRRITRPYNVVRFLDLDLKFGFKN